jgi:hypothetical protein
VPARPDIAPDSPPQRGRLSLAPVQVVSIVLAHHSGLLSTREDEMRTMIATLAGLIALATVSAQAVPLAPARAIPVQFGAGPSGDRQLHVPIPMRDPRENRRVGAIR